MFLLMFADKEPEASTVQKTTTTDESTSTVASTITTKSTAIMSNPPSRIVNNGMLINVREN